MTKQQTELLLAVDSINALLWHLRNAKSLDRTGTDRQIAIAITDAEKLLAWLVYISPPATDEGEDANV